MQSSRIVVIGVAAALVFTGCGQSADDAADPQMQPPTPVRVSGASAGTLESTADSQLGSDAARSSMPAFAGYTFEPGPALPALPTNATGYHYPTDPTVDVARVEELAAALGVEGEPVEGGGIDVDGLSWRVGPDDGTAPMLTVGADAQISVNYSSAWADATTTRCSEPVDAAVEDPATGSAGTVKPDSEVGVDVTCAEPEPPADVPSADEAEALAADVLDSIGLDPSTFEFETYADEWAASVTAWGQFDGVRSPVAWGFGFGENGALQWMNGTLASPVATGPYPLIDLDEALLRLAEQNTWFGGGGVVMEDLGVTPAVGAATESPVEASVPAEATPPSASPVPADGVPVDSVSTDTVTTATVPTDPVLTDTVPVETLPVDTILVDPMPVEPTTEVATLVDVRADLWWAWDEDGSVWLLPAYTFTDTDGRLFTVPSVTDEFLIITEPVLVDPVPLEPVPVDPVPLPDDVPLPDEVPEPDHSDVVGLSVDDASARLAASGLTLRVVIDDGTALAVTEDFSSTRVNVEVADGVVVAVVSIG